MVLGLVEMVIDHFYLEVSSLRKCSPALKADRVTGCKRTTLAKHAGMLEDGGLKCQSSCLVCAVTKRILERKRAEKHIFKMWVTG